MKVLLLLLTAVFLAGCDMEKVMSLSPGATPTPAPTPKPAPTPAPKPKQPDWMNLKNYKSPLDQRPSGNK